MKILALDGKYKNSALDGKCVVNTNSFTRKTLHFMTFCTCDFITERSIANYQEIF